MENRSRTYLAIDELTSQSNLDSRTEWIQPIEVIPFDDKEYQLQLRLVVTSPGTSARPPELIDREKVMDAVSTIRIDNKLGVDNEIIYSVQTTVLENTLFELQVVMTHIRMIDGDKLWSV